MRRIVALSLLTALAAVAAAEPAPAPDRPKATPDAAAVPETPKAIPAVAAAPDTAERFRIRIGSRLYEQWSDEVVVARHEKFFLGDTDLTAEVQRYYLDFKMKDGKPFNASNEPVNPAAFVMVTRDTAAVDSAWAFLNFPPHFLPQSFFTFQLLDLDTTATAAPPPGEK
jgi:hypothetical protein